MPSITAPNIETQQVVTGTSYTLSISESSTGTGITCIEVGPYYFEGAAGQIKYPEAPTNEMCPADFGQCHWVQDAEGSSWLRWQGGIVKAEDHDRIFMFTSNYPPSTSGPAKLRIWRGTRPESFTVAAPDYSQKPPTRNARHDSTGLGSVYQQWGCLPQLVIVLTSIVAIALFLK
jgi:hypothetical protein